MKKTITFTGLCLLISLFFNSFNAAAGNDGLQNNGSDSLSANSEPFVTMLEGGFAHGYMEYEDDYYGLDLVHAYMPNQHLSIGIGVGLHNYAWGFPGELGSYSVLPIYVDFRYYPLNKRFTPYTIVKGGYSVILSEEVGVYMQTGVGFKYQYSNKHSFMLNLLYGIQNFQSYSRNDVGYYDHSTDFKFIESLGFTVGWSF